MLYYGIEAGYTISRVKDSYEFPSGRIKGVLTASAVIILQKDNISYLILVPTSHRLVIIL